MERNGMEYEIVGGIAVSGEYKTRDVDMILLMDEGDAEALEEALRRARFSVRAEDIRALREKSHFTIFDEISEYHVDAKVANTESDMLTLERRRSVVAISLFMSHLQRTLLRTNCFLAVSKT